MPDGSWRSGESARRCRTKRGRRRLDVDLGSGLADEAIGYTKMERMGRACEGRSRAARARGLDVQNPQAGFTKMRIPVAMDASGESARASAKEAVRATHQLTAGSRARERACAKPSGHRQICAGRGSNMKTGLLERVGFEKPLATSEIHSGEKNVEKKEELNSFFDVLVHT